MTEQELIVRYGEEKVETWKQEFQKSTIQNDFIFCKAIRDVLLLLKTSLCSLKHDICADIQADVLYIFHLYDRLRDI